MFNTQNCSTISLSPGRAIALAALLAVVLLAVSGDALANAGSGSARLTLSLPAEELADWEQAYLLRAVERLYSNCSKVRPVDAGDPPLADVDQLSLTYPDGSTRTIQALGDKPDSFAKFALYSRQDGHLQRHHNCNPADVAPVVAIIGSKFSGNSPVDRRTVAKLTSYEPNRVGWTYDDNDVGEGYVDALLSVKYPFLHDGSYSAESPYFNAFFAFTGEFSQYIGSRDSSPVVAKRFNPKFLLRHWLGGEKDYLDIGYAHESNGQNINTERAYQNERNDFIDENQDPDFARDYISRGWDYLTLDWRRSWAQDRSELSSYVKLKYFLDDGLLQGKPEEYNLWEGDGVNHRKQYDGLGLLVKYRFSRAYCLTNLALVEVYDLEPNFCLGKLSWQQTTGYDGIFDHNTSRLEFTVSLWDLPVMLWGQTGYNSDLVDYYRKVNSWGIAVELQSF